MTAPNRIHGWLVSKPAEATRLQLLTIAIGEDPTLVQEWAAHELIPSPEDGFTAAQTVIDVAQSECDAQQQKCKFALRWVCAEGRNRAQTVIKCMPRESAELEGEGEPDPSKQGIVEGLLRHKENDHKQTHMQWVAAGASQREVIGLLMEQNRALFGERTVLVASNGKLVEQVQSLVALCRDLLDEKRTRSAAAAGMVDPRTEAQALAISELASGIRENILPALAAPLSRLIENGATALATRPARGKPGKPPPPANGASGNGKPGNGHGVGN